MYLMEPALHYQLSCVSNFNVLNGKRYLDYIIIRLSGQMTVEQQTSIVNATTANEALELLKKMNISYTHEM